MIKTYRKTATIQAEQFTFSPEQLDKYNILWDGQTNKAWISTLEGDMGLQLGDWIATDVKGEQWAIADDVFKKTYVEVSK